MGRFGKDPIGALSARGPTASRRAPSVHVFPKAKKGLRGGGVAPPAPWRLKVTPGVGGPRQGWLRAAI